jgi:hypothetical protein
MNYVEPLSLLLFRLLTNTLFLALALFLALLAFNLPLASAFFPFRLLAPLAILVCTHDLIVSVLATSDVVAALILGRAIRKRHVNLALDASYA